VRNWLIKKGIDPKRVVFTGFGKSRPLSAGSDEDSRRKNRRTEVEILSVR
jgi:outer membrane protein OmpA-like peptidoglycan-associated protein